MRKDARDRIQDDGRARLFEVGAGAGAGQHAGDDRGPGPQPGLDVAVRIDKSSVEAAALAPGTSVSVTLPPEAVHVVPRPAAS